MDPINNRDNLFSRGPSPPPQPQHFQLPLDQHPSPASSHRDPVPSNTTHIDSLFHNLSAASPPRHISPQSNHGNTVFVSPQDVPASGPATPASVNAGSVASSGSGPSNPTTERQNALLSLLGAVSSPAANPQNAPVLGPVPPQQVPTPPGSAQRAGPSASESQGKFLLEQLMSGNSAPKYNPEPSASLSAPVSGGPSPTYLPSLAEPQSHPEGDYYSGEGTFNNELSRDMSQAPLPQPVQQQQPPSPARRSMFDFISPFDALAGPSSTQAKRKPPPPQPTGAAGGEDTPWPSVSIDPKRKSVENLMDQLTRGQALPQAPIQPLTSSYESYSPGEDITPQAEPSQTRLSRPLPPQPTQISSSPRSSPPKPPPSQRQQRRSADSPIGSIGVQGPFASRDKESSPLPPAGYRHDGPGKGKGNGPRGKSSPNLPTQNIVFDVSQSLDEIQAPRDAVKSTAIALVKVDSTFLPGTTIGATHWVAYAMTKGRVRVISRSSGDRTLLQLPPVFPSSAAVTDMSVHGNRLAGVTSDGGFVVWELPEVIRDDVPGEIMLCVLPGQDLEPLRAVKWHPQQPDTVVVVSDTTMYLLNISDAYHTFRGEPISQSELSRIAQLFSSRSPIVAFDYDVSRSALATISEDSTLTMWNIRDKLPFWSSKIRGEDTPSSLTFVDNAVVIGRRNGTVFQLLPTMGREVLSTIKFVNGNQPDPNMFGHANYDSRIQTLWIANNRRDSMIAFKINYDTTIHTGDDESPRAYFDQIVEFGGPKPTIHFVILTADADPTGEEAHAACVAAKVPPGELALVAFSVHSTGVDQVLIRKEWFTSALSAASAKFPVYAAPPQVHETKSLRPVHQQGMTSASIIPPTASHVSLAPPRIKTPPSEEVEGVESREEGRSTEAKGKGAKGKNVGWKDKDDSAKDKDTRGRGIESPAADSSVGMTLSKEIRKSEDSLHTRIGRLIAKELDKQHQRLEDARRGEQEADFERQEKILKLISTELTKNTTRVVEMAVKAEVQNSVLPSLENITRNEVKAALNNQISKGLAESMKQSLPNEIEKLLTRPDVSNHIARTFSASVTPLVERQVKETITKSLIPAYTQQSSAMHQELSREIHTEILNLKKEIITWQSEALRGQETVIRELEQSIRLLSDQVKYLSLNTATSAASLPVQNRASPVPSTNGALTQLLRHPTLPPVNQVPSNYQQIHGPFLPQQQQQQLPMHGPWFGPNIAAPQASHPAAPPPVPSQPTMMRTPPPAQSEEWDDTYLAVLGTQDTRQLRELLARSNPDAVMPLTGAGPLSQAVVLTLVHRLSQLIGEMPPVDESFKSCLWWLQRASSILNTNDPLISPYVSRVLPNVQSMLNTTKQRLAILPGSPSMDTARTISELQDLLSRKPI